MKNKIIGAIALGLLVFGSMTQAIIVEVWMPMMEKSIKVSDETHSRLAKLGTVGQTFEDVIKELLDFYEAKVKK